MRDRGRQINHVVKCLRESALNLKNVYRQTSFAGTLFQDYPKTAAPTRDPHGRQRRG